MKRAIGVAALGGGLLALGAGTASAQEVSADALARVGRSTSAEVRVCADGRVLSRLLGGCGQASSGGSVQAGRGSGSGQASATRRARADAAAAADTSPRAGADAAASLSRPRAGRLLDLRPVPAWPGWACSAPVPSPWSATRTPATCCQPAS